MKIKILFPILISIALGLFPVKVSVYEASHCLGNFKACSKEMDTGAAYKHLLAVEPWRVDLWESLAQTEMEKENWTEAIAAFNQAADNGALSLQGRSMLGFALLNAGQEENAIQLWMNLIETQQAPADLYQEIFPLLLENLQIDLAEKVISKWAGVEPENAGVQFQYGLLMLLRSHETASSILDTAAELDPDFNASVQNLQRAISQAHLKDDPAYQQLTIARAAANQGFSLHAELLCVQAVQLNPAYAEAWAMLGEMQQQNGRDGLPALETAFELDPESFLVRSLLALYWQRQEKPQESIEIFSQFIEEYPDQPIWRVELAKATAQQGDIPAGLDILLEALKQAPETDAFVLVELANYCAAHQTELSTIGLPSARQALLIEGESPRALTAMGNVLFALNDLDSAQRYYQRVLALEPDNAVVLFQLGMIAYQQQDNTAARAYFNNVLSIVPQNSELYASAQRMLENF